MSFRGPEIFKLNGGLGQTAPSDRNVFGLIVANGYEVSDTFEFGQVYRLTSIEDAEALGLSPASDANNADDTTALIWYNIDEWFRTNPDGTLYVFNGEEVATANLFAANGPANALLSASENGIRGLGIIFGFDPEPAEPYTITGGFADFVTQARSAAQTWVEARATEHIYIDVVVIEGAFAAPVLVDQKTADAPQVHITVACDHGYLDEYDEAFLRTASVGTALAAIGVRMLSESMGSVVLERYPSAARGRANYSLVDTRRGRWMKPGLSSGVLVADTTQSYRDELTDKAYGYAGSYESYPGVYFNADPTCTLVTDDFNTIHINRVWNESARMVRRALIPKMNSRVRIDSTTGRIAPATIADWDAAAKRQLDTLLAEGEISDYTFSLDPEQDVIAQGKVKTRLRIVPQGIAKEIEGEIGFTNPAQA
ncbi:MAG: hypothetical protein KIT10_14580 [Flavobacteriales bacterium]|nr:hypothetical protein [Flavobacteriales bacterium]